MDKITRTALLELGGASDARFAVFNSDGSLYLCTIAKRAEEDELYWEARGYTIKEVVD